MRIDRSCGGCHEEDVARDSPSRLVTQYIPRYHTKVLRYEGYEGICVTLLTLSVVWSIVFSVVSSVSGDQWWQRLGFRQLV